LVFIPDPEYCEIETDMICVQSIVALKGAVKIIQMVDIID